MVKTIETPRPGFSEKQPRKVSIETFLKKYRKGGPGVKYEYNKGIIEKTEAMKFKEQYIAANIEKAFDLITEKKAGSMLVQELEVWTSKDQWRKPDLAFITKSQIAAGARGEEPVPAFVIEVISKTDSILIVKNKVREYFKAGVKILWHIFPDSETVEIYRSPEDIEVCSGDKICSAEPVVDGFRIKAKDVFLKP